MLDADGPDLQAPFEEARECPMMRCVQARRFKTPLDLINHLRVCAETRTGEVRCTSCQTCHSIKKKGNWVKSPVALLQRRWSGRKNAKQQQGRATGPTTTSNGSTQAQEADAADDSDSSSGTDLLHQRDPKPQQLHSDQARYELSNMQAHPANSDWNSMYAAPAAEPKKQACVQAPALDSQANEAFPAFAPPCPSSQPSWSDNSQRSTLFDAAPSSLPGQDKQLSIDIVSSLQSSNGSYHGSSQYSQTDRPNQTFGMMPANQNQWLSGSDLTESPGAFVPSSQGQAPWLGASELEVPPSQYMPVDPRLSDNTRTSFSSAAVAAATSQLRQQMGSMVPTAPRALSESAVPPSQAQLEMGLALYPFVVGSHSFDSYGTNFSDEMNLGGRSGGQSVNTRSETMSVFSENMPPPPMTRNNALKAKRTSDKTARDTTAKIERTLANLKSTPLDELKCPFDNCDYKPQGEHPKNYRAHLARHVKGHDVNATLHCPVPGCTQTISGARKDNVNDHLRRKHGGVTLETLESAGAQSFRERPKRKVLQKPRQQKQQQYGTGRTRLRHGVSDNHTSGDGGRPATPVTLMGISGGDDSMTVGDANNEMDILSQTGPGSVAERRWLFGEAPWTITAGEVINRRW